LREKGKVGREGGSDKGSNIWGRELFDKLREGNRMDPFRERRQCHWVLDQGVVQWSKGSCGQEQGVQGGGKVVDGSEFGTGCEVVEGGLVMMKEILLKIGEGLRAFWSKF
jgi:hypothetical protein